MIDAHCHLEQRDYNLDLDKVIEKCRKAGLKAIVTSCAHPEDLEKTMAIVSKYSDIFATIGLHPEYIKELKPGDKKKTIDFIRKNKDKIVGVGEVGLDFFWVKEDSWRRKQAELFREFITLGKTLNKPLVIHSRDAFEETIQILEEEKTKNVLMHMFGANQLVKRVVENGWMISINTILLKSKKHKKIARDIPLENLLLETDAPWLAPKALLEGDKKARNDPTSIKIVAQKIAEIKKISFEDIWKTCGKNAVEFFKLSVKI